MTSFIWSRESLRRFMISSGSRYSTRPNHYYFTRERHGVQLKRDDYLEATHTYRTEGYNIYYQDEKWIFKNMAQARVWQPTTIRDMTEVDYRVSSCSGDRSIVCNVGSPYTGLLDGCLLLFKGKKRADPNYHSEMNGTAFMDWLKSTVFPKLRSIGKKCVLELDRAKYHTTITEETRKPTKAWNKAMLISGIKRWGGPRGWPEN